MVLWEKEIKFTSCYSVKPKMEKKKKFKGREGKRERKNRKLR